jgi:hypothetical protein
MKHAQLFAGSPAICFVPVAAVDLSAENERLQCDLVFCFRGVAFGSAAPVRSMQQQSFIGTPVLAGPHKP